MARMLGIGIPQVVGHLHCLWWWCGEYVADGDVTPYTDDDIADACGWEGEPSTLMDALIHCGAGGKPGFIDSIDGRRVIHDWYEYIGKLLDKRAVDAKRKAEKRAKAKTELDGLEKPEGSPEDVQRTSNGHPEDGAGTVPYRTVPNRTVHKEEEGKYQPLLDLLKDMPLETFPDDETALKTIARWGMLYPHVNIPEELMRMQAWLVRQPKGKYKEFQRFALNWLKRAEADAVSKLPKEEPATPEFVVVGEFR